MNMIGTTGYDRQPETRQAAPASAPFDRGSDRNARQEKDPDGNRANEPPDAGAASGAGHTQAPRALNVMA